jgi:hypothetical protein
MHTRVLGATITAFLLLVALAGCQASPGTFTRSDAIAATSAWTRDAATAIGSPVSTAVSAGSENCRTDKGYLVTHFQWRTITDLGVPKTRQRAAIATIASMLAKAGWSGSTTSAIVTLTGPAGAKRHGIVRLESAGESQLAVAVTSPCYS